MIKINNLLTKKDIILIVIILSIGVSLLGIHQWIFASCSSTVIYAEITSVFGVETVCLDEDRIFYIEMVPDILFEVRDGQIAFIKSDCADQICVRTGFLGRTGQMAACLPNGMIMFILNLQSQDDDLDIFVR